MSEINHRVGIKATPEQVYEALTTNDGLAAWWTNDVSGAGDEGSTISFRFDGGGPDFEVAELVPNKSVRWWHVGKVPSAWERTEVRFLLQADGEQTFVRFSHSNWKGNDEFLAHCTTKWAVFLLSLKAYLETGKGHPYPHDTQINCD